MSRVIFAQHGQHNSELVPVRDTITMQCTCYNYGKSKHMSLDFPETDHRIGGSVRTATFLLQVQVGLKQLDAPNKIPTN